MHFSVLMSLYIREKAENLHHCLQSLYNQTLHADEIVLVYDGPISEDLENVVNHWMTYLPINIVKLKENVGLGQALNCGLAQCKHDIVARMDTDDICHSDRFMKQIDFLSNNKDVAILGSYIEEFDASPDNIISKRVVPINHQDIEKQIKKQNPFNHMSVVFSKSKVIQVGGYQHHYLMEDYNLWLRLLTSNVKAANLPSVLVYVRAGKDMINRRSGWRYISSEYHLARLKRSLGYQNIISSYAYFVLRSAPRLFPLFLLKMTYHLIRKKNHKETIN
ncbi:glycosyltransferase [Citrobacter sedlakii]|uniref:Glycosyltransferase n=1 Tax=Citrobacter sedlakii TaxID=67826 RepID=A0ABS0ZPQ5_9ENTR|nr:glycosyltransferase [Citrobacter sedlakii]MBJ8380797.1 glycosyltransferase [Citrobacter sedlakii]HCT5819430.1 glycosyltransferase [Citrobacter sedlakii]